MQTHTGLSHQQGLGMGLTPTLGVVRPAIEGGAPRSNLYPDVRIEMPKTSPWEGAQGPFREFAATREFIIAAPTDPNSRPIIFQMTNGKIINVADVPPFQLTYSALLGALRRNNSTAIDLSGPGNPKKGIISLAGLLDSLNLEGSLRDEAANFLTKCAGNSNRWTRDEIRRASPPRWCPPYQLSSAPDLTKFAVTLGDKTFIYDPQSSASKRTLSPQRWASSTHDGKDDLWNGDENFGATDLKVSFKDEQLKIGRSSRAPLFQTEARAYCVSPLSSGGMWFVTKDGANIGYVSAQLVGENGSVPLIRPLPVDGEAQALKVDPRGNFLLALVKRGASTDLVVLDGVTLAVQHEVSGMGRNLMFDPAGHLLYLDSHNALQRANTNFGTYRAGQVAEAHAQVEQRRTQLTQALQERLGMAPIAAASTDEVLATWKKRVVDKIENTESTQALDLVKKEIEDEIIKFDRVFAAELRADLTRQIEVKNSWFVGISLRNDMQSLGESLVKADSIESLLELEEQSHAVREQRATLIVADPKLRAELSTTMQQLEHNLNAAEIRLSPVVEAAIKKHYVELEGEIAQAENQGELIAVQHGAMSRKFDQVVGLLPDGARRDEWLRNFSQNIQARERELVLGDLGANRDRREALARELERLNTVEQRVFERLAAIENSADLKQWLQSNPELRVWNELVELLPIPEQRRRNAKFALSLERRQRSLDIAEHADVQRRDGTISFGKHDFPIYVPDRYAWRAVLEPSGRNSKAGVLEFRDTSGRVFRPDIGSLPLDIPTAEFRAIATNYEAEAAEFFKVPRRMLIPDISHHWVLNEFVKGQLDDIAESALGQMRLQSGITILRGDTGSGKNVLLDILHHFSKRELVVVSCNPLATKSDLTYQIHYNPKEGTLVMDAEVIRAAKTPGVSICFDEINTLPTGAAKLLLSGLDERRKFFLSDGRRITWDPTVLAFGTENVGYLGTQPLSQEFKSRASIIDINYPTEELTRNGHKWRTPYEAEIMARHIPLLGALSQRDFYLVWEHVANAIPTPESTALLTPEREALLESLQCIVKVANRIRYAYDQFQRGLSNHEVRFVYGLRESVNIAAAMAEGHRPREAVLKTVLPKIDKPAEQERVAKIIRDIPE